MLKTLYIHHYRSLQNFELNLTDLNSALLLGRNGAGKSNIFDALEIFQRIGQGQTQVSALIDEHDFAFGEMDKAIRFELVTQLENQEYHYQLEIDLPHGFYQPRVKHESLNVGHQQVFVRKDGKTTLNHHAEFTLDWHHIGLPLISTRNINEPIAVFKAWLARIIVLAPIPSLFNMTSNKEDAYLHRQGQNVLDWLRYQLTQNPSSYSDIEKFIKQRMPDFLSFKFDSIGRNERELIFLFQDENKKKLELNFNQLSDGEKIYFLTAILLVNIVDDNPTLCFWDEPDNFVSLLELSQFISACRKQFENSPNHSQLLVSTHNPKAINEFSSHNSFILSRKNHLHPTRIELLNNKQYLSPTLLDAFENGELDEWQ
ncbi:MAG: AAA family ATPase [Acinetobacter populi]|jgi:predicted ATPase|uniref:AAA family ATPase n=1 Tax=Acinetobacter populi TaxID=1582270 RepID=UPI0023570627|nr:AAA family ATPase [Acinetobacter populi]MCH4247893.1 AAA family ATPase [Acinetobacter populi]